MRFSSLFSFIGTLSLFTAVHARPSSIEPRQLLNRIAVASDDSIRRSDDKWACNPLRVTANFLAAPATLTAVRVPYNEANFTTLATVGILSFPAELDYAVELPVEETFALRLEDATGQVTYSHSLKVEPPAQRFLMWNCEKRIPNWFDRNRNWLDVVTLLFGIILLAVSMIASIVWLAERELEKLELKRVPRRRQPEQAPSPSSDTTYWTKIEEGISSAGAWVTARWAAIAATVAGWCASAGAGEKSQKTSREGYERLA
ncbi:hypothetical protein JCM10207_007889 [Rhodosporidiobolus poonsookiae]